MRILISVLRWFALGWMLPGSTFGLDEAHSNRQSCTEIWKCIVLLRSNVIIDEGLFPWLRHVTWLQSHSCLIEPPMCDGGSYTQIHPSMAAVMHDLEL
jgi:hypothetical protein